MFVEFFPYSRGVNDVPLTYISTTPHLLSTSPDASMFNLKEDVGGGLQLEGEDIEIVDSTST